MQIKLLTSVYLSICGNELIAFPSLFFTDEDIKAIRESKRDKTAHSLKLHLSALVYRDQNHWSLWVNHKIIRPETHRDIDGFHLERVMPHEVTFSWIARDSTTPIIFTLRPSQTYVTKE
ncbi:MAG TPA: hypothetical protein VMW10_06615 [Alphaproteobacteria bacterium]|nr:hypothetical protein [Alphaproteobacteria bacterium]